MIIFRGFSAVIAVSKKEFCFYNTYYLGDKFGNPIDKNDNIIGKNGEIIGKAKNSETFSFGDIIIESPCCRYIFKAVPEASFAAREIMDFICKKICEDIIIVDLEKICGELDEKEFVTEAKTPCSK